MSQVLNRVTLTRQRKRLQGEAQAVRRFRTGVSGPAFPPRSVAAFSLIELIGVLAILTILAGILTPVVIRQIDRAAWNGEVTNLNSLSNAVALQVLRNKNVPSDTTWGAAAANWTSLPLSSITNNPRSVQRAFLIDTNGWLGSVTLPFTQTADGTTVAAGARLMLLSSIAKPLPVSSGKPGTTAFNTIWNTRDGAKPSTWTNWTGKGDELVIQRINLQPLFHRVILFNRDTNTSYYFTIDGTYGSSPVTVATFKDAYYLDGSVLGLTNASGSATNSTLSLTQIINADLSRISEAGIWGDQIGAGTTLAPSSLLTNLDQVAYSFVVSPSPPVSKRGDNTMGVADMLLSYMMSYNSWANMSPCFSFLGNGNTKFVPEATLMTTVMDCFNNPGNGSCQIVP